MVSQSPQEPAAGRAPDDCCSPTACSWCAPVLSKRTTPSAQRHTFGGSNGQRPPFAPTRGASGTVKWHSNRSSSSFGCIRTCPSGCEAPREACTRRRPLAYRLASAAAGLVPMGDGRSTAEWGSAAPPDADYILLVSRLCPCERTRCLAAATICSGQLMNCPCIAIIQGLIKPQLIKSLFGCTTQHDRRLSPFFVLPRRSVSCWSMNLCWLVICMLRALLNYMMLSDRALRPLLLSHQITFAASQIALSANSTCDRNQLLMRAVRTIAISCPPQWETNKSATTPSHPKSLPAQPCQSAPRPSQTQTCALSPRPVS